MVIEVLLGVLITNTIYQGVKLRQLQEEIKQTKCDETNIWNTIYRNDLLAHKRIDQEIDRVNNLHKDSIQYTTNSILKQDSIKK